LEKLSVLVKHIDGISQIQMEMINRI